jgi:hypothetical protein
MPLSGVTEYANLKQRARDLYVSLKAVRLQIQTMEDRMIREMQTTQQPICSAVSENQQAVIKLQERTRRIPLTQADLKGKLRDCLHEQFGHSVGLPKIEEFAIAIAHRIWTERRTKRVYGVLMKLVTV